MRFMNWVIQFQIFQCIMTVSDALIGTISLQHTLLQRVPFNPITQKYTEVKQRHFRPETRFRRCLVEEVLDTLNW